MGQVADSVKPMRNYKNVIRYNLSGAVLFGFDKYIVFGYERVIKKNQTISVNIGGVKLPTLISISTDSFSLKRDRKTGGMTEVRRVGWPAFESIEFSEKMFLQGIAGTLELFHLSIAKFQEVVESVTGQSVPDFQRIDQAGQRLPIDERILADTDTLMVFGLDHLITEQEASPEEIEAL